MSFKTERRPGAVQRLHFRRLCALADRSDLTVELWTDHDPGSDRLELVVLTADRAETLEEADATILGKIMLADASALDNGARALAEMLEFEEWL